MLSFGNLHQQHYEPVNNEYDASDDLKTPQELRKQLPRHVAVIAVTLVLCAVSFGLGIAIGRRAWTVSSREGIIPTGTYVC